MTELLNNVQVKYISGCFILTAEINKNDPLSTHFLAFDIMSENGIIASLDPWQSKIDYRFKTINNKIKIIGRLEKETIELSDWIDLR